MTRASAAILGIVGLLSTANVIEAQSKKFNVGTLTCLIGVGTIEEVREPRSLTCTFVSSEGASVEYSGTIRNLMNPAPSADQNVLVWTVLSASKEIPGNMLDGRYAGEVENNIVGTVRDPQGSLIGGENSSIELQPLTPLPGIKPGGTFVDVELNLQRTLI